jgi:hypothetical protein
VVFMPVCDIWKVNKNEMKCWANGDVLTAWRAFKAAWLSQQILRYFSGPFWNFIS